MGGNKPRLDHLNSHKDTLKQVKTHANTAANRIHLTIRNLLIVAEAIKDLRERLIEWVDADEFALPIERHLEIVMDGAIKLAELQEAVRQNREGASDWVAHGPKYPTI